MGNKALTVSQVSALTEVTVRALHHYDEIGLLSPSARSDAGYRLYSSADLDRLQSILSFRDLGFALEEIAGLLDADATERVAALQAQHGRLVEQREHTTATLRAVEDLEARERWGETDMYKEASRRTRGYGKAEWQALGAEMEANIRRFAELCRDGQPADAAEARAAAEAARLHCDRWFYPCSHAMHGSLADLYVSDPRFRATYDRHLPGLADYVAAAIKANLAANR